MARPASVRRMDHNTSSSSPKTNTPFFIALQLAWELGYLIAIPAVIFGFAGAYLDKVWRTSPLCLLVGLVLALAISTLGVWRTIQRLNKEDQKPGS